MKWITRRSLLAAAPAAMALAAGPARAAQQYYPGASDTEIRIGNIMPYSGPASAYGVIGKTEARFFATINEEGGINGRKITFLSYDDGYSPPQDGRAGAPPGRERPGPADLQLARHADQY